jgi:ribosomal protein L13E
MSSQTNELTKEQVLEAVPSMIKNLDSKNKLILMKGLTKEYKLNASELKNLGFSATDLKDAGFNSSDLKDAGYSAEELYQAGFSLQEIHNGGFTYEDMKINNMITKDLIIKLANNGTPINYILKLGYPRDEIASLLNIFKKNNYSLKRLKNAGFEAKELYEAGFTIKELKKVGFINLRILRLTHTIRQTFKKKSSSNNRSRRNKEMIHLGTIDENQSFRSAVGNIPPVRPSQTGSRPETV